MFYCDECMKKRNWPTTAFKSEGKCEICRKMAICNDKPASELPDT